MTFAAASAEEPLLVALARRLQAGDAGALEPFIAETRPVAFRLACKLLNDWHAAHDVLQDAYLTVLKEARGLRNVAAVKTWFLRIVTTRCLVLMRKHKPRSIDDLGSGELVEPGTVATEAEHRIELQRALAQLSPDDRAILILRECLDMSYEDISATLRVPMGTVKRRLFEARKRLARHLMEVVP